MDSSESLEFWYLTTFIPRATTSTIYYKFKYVFLCSIMSSTKYVSDITNKTKIELSVKVV